jgi:nucleotide-binding universal stress UspA family protein
MKVEKILIPTDFSHNAQLAFDHAYELARLLQAKLYVVHVQDENTLRTAVMEGLLNDHSTDKKLENEVDRLIQSRLSTTLAGHAFPEVIVERLSLRGDPDAVIPAYAREINVDLMVVGMRGTSMIEKVKSVVLGSVAASLIEKSPCPILLIRPDYSS